MDLIFLFLLSDEMNQSGWIFIEWLVYTIFNLASSSSMYVAARPYSIQRPPCSSIQSQAPHCFNLAFASSTWLTYLPEPFSKATGHKYPPVSHPVIEPVT